MTEPPEHRSEPAERPSDAADRPPETRPLYKGAPLDEARGPGLGCFWLQVVLLAVLVVLTPIAGFNDWPIAITTALLVGTLVLLFLTGQTLIFLLRLVAADRRARRRPLASRSKTVGEIEDDERAVRQ